MTRAIRDWLRAGLPPGACEALAEGLPGSRLWSLLLEVAASRAASRRLPDLAAQWSRDGFVQPAAVDQRTLNEIDRHLLAAADRFEAVELSPVAPLGVCSQMAPTSQNRVLSALRGTEAVADPSNVLALECARRLRKNPGAVVRLATSHRCVRAQPVPPLPGFALHFRMFCMVSAGFERKDHGFVVDTLVEHARTMLDALVRLGDGGFAIPPPPWRVTVLAATEQAALGDRVGERLSGVEVARAVLEHPYYSGGLRFQINVGTGDAPIPLIDGGSFDWAAKLLSNRRAVYVASAIGSQLVGAMFARGSFRR